MKASKSLFEDTMRLLSENGYRVKYVPHKLIEDYNAAYNVMCGGKLITTGAAEELGILLNEIWIDEMWKPYERFILFRELREIHYKAEGVCRDEAHEKAVQDASYLWENDPLWQKMLTDIAEMDRKTAEKRNEQE